MQISAASAVTIAPAAISPAAAPAPVPTSIDPVDPAPPTEPPAPVTPPSRFLQMLASGHFNPVADLRHRMQFAQEIKEAGLQLPDPPASAGHGKAYAKFLAAYQAMSAPTLAAAPAEPTPAEPAPTQPSSTQPTVFACLDRQG